MSNRCVIVTGASSGIGEATARAFARAGDRVVLAARRLDRLRQLADELPGSVPVQVDLTERGAPARLVAAALEHASTVDVLVNNAGAGTYDFLEALPEETIVAEVSVNLLAPVLLARAVLPVMLAQRRGVIINVCSIAGKIGTPTTSIYNASKFGLDGFGQALHREVRAQGVHVCTIYPGPTAGTEFSARRQHTARLRVPNPAFLKTRTEHVARAIVALADRPRARRVIPAWYHVPIAANALAPGLLDLLIGRVASRGRRGPATVPAPPAAGPAGPGRPPASGA